MLRIMGKHEKEFVVFKTLLLEFTILKHEVIVLRLKNNKVLEKIRSISRLWPKKKVFIEGAYKILLFTKN